MSKNPNAYTLHDGDAEIVGQIQAGTVAVQNAVLATINNKLAVDGSAVITEAQKNALNGYAGLDANGKLLASVIPNIGISSVTVVASQAAQLALSAQEGDIAVRSDEAKTYIHNGGTTGTMADWTFIASPTNVVQSVAGKTGVVTLEAADITDLSTALAGKANTVHTHTLSSITDAGTSASRDVANAGNASSSQVVKGDDTRLSDARTPVSHSHAISDVTNLDSTLQSGMTAITGINSTLTTIQSDLNNKANSVHTHAIADVTGLQAALDAKSASSHTHTLSAITDSGTAASKNIPTSGNATSDQVVLGSDTRLTDSRNPTAHKTSHATGGSDALTPADIGAASSTHTHPISDVTNLQSSLDGKASTSHTHTISDVTNLQTELDGKASSGHQHYKTGGVGIGTNALFSATTGEDNIAIGTTALYDLTDGTNNVAIGSLAGQNITGGDRNVAIGRQALEDVTTSNDNTALGYRANANNTTASSNVAVGSDSLFIATTGDLNTAVGSGALGGITTGSANTAIGNEAGTYPTTGANNVFIGRLADASANTSNSIAIGYNTSVGASNEVVIGNTSITKTKLEGEIIVGSGSEGALALPITTISSNTTLNDTHFTVLVEDGNTNTTVTLPAAANCKGRIYVIKNVGILDVTIDGNGSETIDGSTTKTLTGQWTSLRIQSNGSNWFTF